MIPVNEAFRLIQSNCPDFGMETVPLEDSCGRILRQQVIADRDFPPFDRVCMDGIAIDYQLYASGRRKFYRQGVLSAGEAPPALVGPEACVEVMTGAVLPPGTDTVIPYEHLEESRENDGAWYLVRENVSAGQHIHSRGADASHGAVLLEKEVKITPPAIAVMASAGVSRVKVSRMPQVSIICSGDELVPVSGNPLPYQIRQSNGPTLKALLQQHGVQSRLYHVRDAPGQMNTLLQQILRSQTDCIITIGGVSAGKKDYVPSMVTDGGGEILFHKVAQRPGKPFLFAKWKNGPVLFGLPGNPVSCLACCCRYVLPWIWEGLQGVQQQRLYAKLTEEMTIDLPLTCFIPVSLACNINGEFMAKPLKGKGSGDFISVQNAAAFLELPAAESRFVKGSAYRAWPV